MKLSQRVMRWVCASLTGVLLFGCAAVGITHGSTFRARLGDEHIDVFLGKSYKDVPRGEWVGLIEEDGNLQIAISFGHAATILGCQEGDTLLITPIAAP